MLVMLLNMDVLTLMNNELEVNFYIRKLFHSLECAFVGTFLVFFEKLLYRLV